MSWPGDLQITRIADRPAGAFDCRRDEQNRFYFDRSWADQAERLSTTYVLQVHGVVAGFLTVCMDALMLSRRERGPAIHYQSVSALKLAQLGVDHRFQGLGLGTHALGFVITLANQIAGRVGCRYVTLDAQPDLQAWYAARGFVRNELHHESRVRDAVLHGRDPDRIALSMRHDLRRG